METKHEIVYIPVSDVKTYENNPRNISENAVNAVAESIKKYGFLVPVILTENNTIVAGHTRIKAATLLKLKEVPCIRATGLTDTEIKAFRLIDNRSAEFTEWDFSKLMSEIQNIPEIDLSEFDFESLFEEFESETGEIPEAEVFEYIDSPLANKSKKNNNPDFKCPACGHTSKKNDFMADDASDS